MLTSVPVNGNIESVRILGRGKLHDFALRHEASRRPLARWEDIVRAANWKSLIDLQATFRSADLVADKVVFNVGGNKYRLTAIVDFRSGVVLVTGVRTHEEYNK
jgi:mRNA interferase HigB